MKWMIVPPIPGSCPICAAKHEKEEPHNRDSLYYKVQFYNKHGRMPTWADAMAHCDEDTKEKWKGALIARGERKEDFETGE